MNRKVFTWLPPDGDVRLVRLQQNLWQGSPSGTPLVPVYLELRGRAPEGPVRTGRWLRAGELRLEALDDQGLVGEFRFGVDGDPPPEPGWEWRKGVTALLELRFPHGDPQFMVWTWLDRRGWKASSRP